MGHNDQFMAINTGSFVFRRLLSVDAALSQYTPGAGGIGDKQDPEEFQSRYPQACSESVDHR